MKTRKKILSFLLVLTLIMTSLPAQLFATEVVDTPIILQTDLLDSERTTPAIIDINPNVFVGNGYKVEFKVSSQWPGAFNGEIILTNTGGKALENWTLAFDFEHEINSMWNAQIIKHEGTSYLIKNLQWNQDIAPGSSVSIGFGAKWSEYINPPKGYNLLGTEQQVADEDYTIAFKVVSDWGQAFNGEISITNNTEEPIEDWTLEFGFDRNIDRFWTAEIVKREGNHYIIKNLGYNANIAPGRTLTLGFAGNPGNVDNEPSGYKLNQIGQEIDYEKDTDGDGLPDFFERELGTNPNKADTDDDGLPDAYEYFVLGTDPLKPDTDDNGILDGDEDFDEDELTNLEEFSLGTNPLSRDSDGDSLDDKKEVEIGTNPLCKDSDNDKLDDGAELELGTNPINPDTNGNTILDGEEIYDVQRDLESNSLVEASINIDLEGQFINSLEIKKIENDDFYLPSNMPGFISNGHDFELNGTFEKATLTYKLDSSLLEKPDFQPAIYYCNTDEQTLELIDDQFYDKDTNTVTGEINHFSYYILLNKIAFDEAFKEEILGEVNQDKINTPMDLVIILDSSGSMTTNDPLGIRKQVSIELVNQLREFDKTAVISFDTYANVLQSFSSDKDSIISSIRKVGDNGWSTNLSAGIASGLAQFDGNENNELKYMIFLTDGVGSYSTTYTTQAAKKGIVIYTVGLGTQIDSNLLAQIANGTNGKYFHADNANGLIEEFNKICENIVDIYTDSDNDGVSDYHESRIRLFNGLSIQTDVLNPDTDGDGLLDGQEIIPVYTNNTVMHNAQTTMLLSTPMNVESTIHHYMLLSHPQLRDSDGDGFTDDEDTTRFKAVAYKNIDYYLKKNYKDKSTIAFFVETPNKGSRIVIDPEDDFNVGHTFVRIDTNTSTGLYRGFYPETGLALKDIALQRDVDGKVRTEKDYYVTDGGKVGESISYGSGEDTEAQHPWYVAKVYSTSTTNIDKALKYTNNYNKKYNMVRNNCTTFAVNTLKNANISSPTNTTHWQIPDSVREMAKDTVKFKWIADLLESNLKGYTPADAAEDIREGNSKYLLYVGNANNGMPGLKVMNSGN